MNGKLRASLVAGLTLVVLLACAQFAQAEEGSAAAVVDGRIMTEEQYRATIVGKRIDLGNGYADIHENGKITGKVGNKKLTGKWAWKGDYYCRIVRLDGQKLPFDCQVVIVSGNKVTSIRNKGNGKRVTYRILERE